MVRLKIGRQEWADEWRGFTVTGDSPWKDILLFGEGSTMKECSMQLELRLEPRKTYEEWEPELFSKRPHSIEQVHETPNKNATPIPVYSMATGHVSVPIIDLSEERSL